MQARHPLAYLIKALRPRSMGLSTYEKEYLAILVAVDQWRHYLQHVKFHIHTDQRSLPQLAEQRLHTPWQQKYSLNCSASKTALCKKKKLTTESQSADALFCKVVHESSCAALVATRPHWLFKVVASYANDLEAQSMLAKLALDSWIVPHFIYKMDFFVIKIRFGWVRFLSFIASWLLYFIVCVGWAFRHYSYIPMPQDSICLVWSQGSRNNICSRLWHMPGG